MTRTGRHAGMPSKLMPQTCQRARSLEPTRPHLMSGRHVFCGGCLRDATAVKPACPVCRADVVEDSATRDRLAGALVDNLPSRCQLHGSGCTWTGRYGDRSAHLATACPCVTLACPTCALELPRSAMEAHRVQCSAQQRGGACPWECGSVCADADALAAHKAVCLMEPRKLIAALGMLQKENERLTSENLAMRAHGQADMWSSSYDDELADPHTRLCTPQKRGRRMPPRGPGLCERG